MEHKYNVHEVVEVNLNPDRRINLPKLPNLSRDIISLRSEPHGPSSFTGTFKVFHSRSAIRDIDPAAITVANYT